MPGWPDAEGNSPKGRRRRTRGLGQAGGAHAAESSESRLGPRPDDRFPEVVLHGSARLNPRLKVYYERLPRTMSHSGGYYIHDDEGELAADRPGVAVRSLRGGGHIRFRHFRRPAAGCLAAALATGAEAPGYANPLDLARFDAQGFVAGLEKIARSNARQPERLHTGSVSPNLCALRRGVRAV